MIEKGHTVSWLGTQAGIESELVPNNDIEIDYINISGVRGKGVAGLLQAPMKIWKAINESKAIFNNRKPSCVLGMGGFAAGPGGVAAKLMGIPLVIHEQNAIPGTTNKILTHFANVVLEAFPHTFKNSVAAKTVGNPVRKDLQNVAHQVDHHADLKLLVLGGSLGAKAINEAVAEMINSTDQMIDVWHQTGKKHIDDVEALYGEDCLDMKSIELSAFIDDMAEAYTWADVVVCRSGAMTVSELAVAGVPAVFIPFPFAIDDHQTANANWMVNAGAAEIVQQKDMDAGVLRHLMKKFNRNRALLDEMRAKATALGVHDATENVVQTCLELAA